MRFELSISDEARGQLYETRNWYAEQSGSEDVATTWYEGFMAAFESLQENPHICSLARENDSFPYELRELTYGSGRRKTHRALFRIQGNRVEVMAIRHAAQRDVTPEDF